jgi:hypothetical protein
MKRLIIIAVLACFYSFVYGQKSIDALFDRYAGKEGFTTVTINGDLLKFVRCFDNDSDKNSKLKGSISLIRVLTQEDKDLDAGNFYDMIIKDIDLKAYEEFMRVKEKNQDVRILVKADGKRFREFLLIAGGEDNAVVQIKGDLSLEDTKKLSENAGKNKAMDIFAEQQ